MKLLIGCDPELFMKRGDTIVSAHNAVPGTKKQPYKVDRGAVQVDGMALEFNIDPAENAEEFSNNIVNVIAQLSEMVPDAELIASPVADFSLDYINQQPQEARELGCEPDYNAYTGNANPRPNAEVPFRTASGHVHIGWTEGVDPFDPEHFEACRMLTKELDVALAGFSTLYDKDTRRRTLYGALGAFRPKSYGLEYRVLSNAWLRDPDLMKWVFNQTKLAFGNLVNGERTALRNKFDSWAHQIHDGSLGRLHIDHIAKVCGYLIPPIRNSKHEVLKYVRC